MLSPCCLTNCLFEVAFALSTLTLPLHVQANSAGVNEASPTANSACPYGTLRGGTVVTRGKNWQWGDEDVDVSASPPKLAEGYVLDDVACGNWASVQWTFSQERAYKYRWYVVDEGANDGAAGNVATRTKVDVDLFIIRRAQPLTATVTTATRTTTKTATAETAMSTPTSTSATSTTGTVTHRLAIHASQHTFKQQFPDKFVCTKTVHEHHEGSSFWCGAAAVTMAVGLIIVAALIVVAVTHWIFKIPYKCFEQRWC